VHRIGRTGRGGKIGIATTFINMSSSQTVLLDLKVRPLSRAWVAGRLTLGQHLLREAKQKIPPILESMDEMSGYGAEVAGSRGCAFCGGLGHRINVCPKLESQQKAKMISTRGDGGGGGGGGGGDW
jgi:ATP-dependent RNA helicase DDX41